MGLDMFLTGERHFHTGKSPSSRKKGELFDLGYWRKHPNLHGFIVRHFADGDDCHPVHLDEDDLAAIVVAIEVEALPHTDGFFFGKSDGSEKASDLEIFRAAIAWLEEADEEASRFIHYQASW